MSTAIVPHSCRYCQLFVISLPPTRYWRRDRTQIATPEELEALEPNDIREPWDPTPRLHQWISSTTQTKFLSLQRGLLVFDITMGELEAGVTHDCSLCEWILRTPSLRIRNWRGSNFLVAELLPDEDTLSEGAFVAFGTAIIDVTGMILDLEDKFLVWNHKLQLFTEPGTLYSTVERVEF